MLPQIVGNRPRGLCSVSIFAGPRGRQLGWRMQLNVRNLLDDDDIEPLRASFAGGGLDWGRVGPRQVVFSTSFIF